MSAARFLPLLLVVSLFSALLAARSLVVAAGPPASADDGQAQGLTDAQRRGSLSFDPAMHPLDRQAIESAIAGARPEARALIDSVDGAVTMKVGTAGPGAAGYTAGGYPTGYEVVLDLASVSRDLGRRGIARLVLHELAHVVDHALVSKSLATRLDAAIPRGYACDPGIPDAACAAREERFAESFAKWATGDIGISLSIGYRVPPPYSVDTWGAPLAGLTDR